MCISLDLIISFLAVYSESFNSGDLATRVFPSALFMRVVNIKRQIT